MCSFNVPPYFFNEKRAVPHLGTALFIVLNQQLTLIAAKQDVVNYSDVARSNLAVAVLVTIHDVA